MSNDSSSIAAVPAAPITVASEIRRVIAMAIPVVLTTGARAMMDVIDFIIISWLPDKEPQAAILPAQMLMWSFIVLGLGIVSMVSTFASQALGRKQYSECSAYAWQTLYIAVFFGLIAFAVRPFLPWMIAWIGHSPEIQALELAYLDIALLTTGPSIASQALGWFFVGVHRPWTTTWTAIEANIVNTIVCVVLVFGYLGFEPMGIAGAAWGTLIALCYRTLRLTISLLTPSMNRQYASMSTWRPSWSRLRRLLSLGWPCSLQWFSDVSVWALFVNLLVGRKFGTAHLIATNAVWQYMRIAFMPAIGVGQAVQSLVGKSIGQGNPNQAKREASIASGLTLAYMGTLSVIYWIYGAELIRWFNGESKVIEIGAAVMIYAAVFQLFDGLGIIYNSALKGAGDTFIPSLFFVLSTWLVVFGGGWVAIEIAPQMESRGPWLAAASLIVITGVFLWWRWWSEAWRGIDIFDHRSPATS